MISRPQPAHWFQLLVARDDLHRALPLLASHQGIQLACSAPVGNAQFHPLLSAEINERLQKYQPIAQLYRDFWPSFTPEKAPFTQDWGQTDPIETLDTALNALNQWASYADPLIQQLLQKQTEKWDLELYLSLSGHWVNLSSAIALLESSRGPLLAAHLFVLPEALGEQSTEESMLLYPMATENHFFLLAVGEQQTMRGLCDRVAAAKGRILPFPQWPMDTPRGIETFIKIRLLENEDFQERLNHALMVLNTRFCIIQHVQAVERLQWFFAVLEKVHSGDCFAQLNGWTDSHDASATNLLLNRFHVRALLDCSPKGPDDPPMLMVNPWWAKPFELFATLLGTPGQNEADPSRLLSFVAPLMFGFMFGDVGQGIVFILAGLLLRSRFRVAWLLITGGLSAVFFGLLFGSFFCYEGLFPPLWMSPVHHPLPLLATPLILGFVLIVLGLALDGLGHAWAGERRSWWLQESGILLSYMGVAGALFHPVGWGVAAVGLVGFVVGNRIAGLSVGAVLIRLAHFLENGLQLAVNTLSFARVGAFALAHAGLSQAVVTLAELNQNPWMFFLVLLLGNIVILVLEGLVVSVQTTRLILFEFFVRFLRGSGRVFQPLPPPHRYT